MKLNNTKIMQGSILLVGILVTLLTGCGGGGGSTPPPVRTLTVPTPTAVGVASGVAASATIGDAGGSVVSADGKMTVNIPAGALANDTLITIQPITNKAHGGMGLAYRLTPDGQTFTQPVELKFAYSDQDLGGSDPEILGAAYQTAEGFWQWFGTPTIDKDAKTVSVDTTHFTDETVVPRYKLVPQSKTIKVKQSLPMQVAYCYPPKSSADKTSLGTPCENLQDMDLASVSMVTEWSVNGILGGNGTVGTISGHGDTATYTAPATKPSSNPVTVSAQVNFGGGNKTRVVSTIKITDIAPPYTGFVVFEERNGPFELDITDGFANVTWTLVEESSGARSYKPTGTIRARVTPPDCDPQTVSTDLSSPLNAMVVYTESTGIPNTHAFVLQSVMRRVDFQCGGNPKYTVTWPVSFSARVINCGETQYKYQVPFTDQAELKGSYVCVWPGPSPQDIWSVGWDFVAQ